MLKLPSGGSSRALNLDGGEYPKRARENLEYYWAVANREGPQNVATEPGTEVNRIVDSAGIDLVMIDYRLRAIVLSGFDLE